MPARKAPPGEPRFRLQVEPDGRGGRAVVVLQRFVRRVGEGAEIAFAPVARARGLPLEVATPLLAGALREAGQSAERLGRVTREGDPPLELGEAAGARVALALVAVQPLRRLDRMEAVVRGIADMTAEEALYWFARAMRGPRPRVLRALRILLAKE